MEPRSIDILIDLLGIASYGFLHYAALSNSSPVIATVSTVMICGFAADLVVMANKD
jgi:hypothetical protein